VCAGERPRAAPAAGSVLRKPRRSFIWRGIIVLLSIYPRAPLGTAIEALGYCPLLLCHVILARHKSARSGFEAVDRRTGGDIKRAVIRIPPIKVGGRFRHQD